MKPAAFLVWVPLLPLMSVPVAASDLNPLGLYIGGAIGQARDTYSAFGASDATRTGWKALAGVKPNPFFGGEIEYVDFGDARFSAPNGDGPLGGGGFGTAHTTAVGFYGVGYLPLPLPYWSIYAKAGMERLHTSGGGVADCPVPTECLGPWNANQAQTDFAYGGGVQVRFERLAFRAEYEHADSHTEHPNLLSFGATWTF